MQVAAPHLLTHHSDSSNEAAERAYLHGENEFTTLVHEVSSYFKKRSIPTKKLAVQDLTLAVILWNNVMIENELFR